MNSTDYNLKIILLAAGKSKRFNDIKLLAKVSQQDDSITLIEHALKQILVSLNSLNIGERNLYIATGGYHDQIKLLLGNQYIVDFCKEAHLGLGHTIAQSVKKIISNDSHTSHIMIMLADQIALCADDYVNLIKQSLLTPDKLICAKAGSEIMPPAIFSRAYFADLMALQGDKGAKALLLANREKLQQIVLPNAAVDIDTQTDLARWYERNV